MTASDAQLEDRLGHKFSNPALLDRALTHSSVIPELRLAHSEEIGGSLPAQNLPQDNEQLEFLGDAVLDMLASERLLEKFPQWSEGQLSKSRARIVNASALELPPRRLRFGEHLHWGGGEERTAAGERPRFRANALKPVFAAV